MSYNCFIPSNTLAISSCVGAGFASNTLANSTSRSSTTCPALASDVVHGLQQVITKQPTATLRKNPVNKLNPT